MESEVETDCHYQDSRASGSLDIVVHNGWCVELSPNNLILCGNDLKRNFVKDKKKHVHSPKIEGSHFCRLVSLTKNTLKTDEALKVYGSMGRETGMKEYKELLSWHIELARETDDPEVQAYQNNEAHQIFQSMMEMGFPIEEDTYGPFLKYLIDKEMVQEFYFFSNIFKRGESVSVPRLVYYEMLLCIKLSKEDRIKQLIYDCSLIGSEDKHLFQESFLLAMCESDCREEFLMLLETFDVTKASSEERLIDIFKSLGTLSLESYAQKFLLELKTGGAELTTLTNYIYEYAINIPNLPVEDVASKCKQLHSEMEMNPTTTHYERLITHYCKLLQVHVAIDLADEMFNVGVTPSLEIIDTMLRACLESYEYNMVHRIYSIIRRQGLELNSETFKSLISLTVKKKDFKGASAMLKEMVEMNIAPTIDIYNMIMAGYSREKNISGALAVLKQMDKANVKADSHTFSYLISHCDSGKKIDKILLKMDQSGIQATKRVVMALINAFAACGEFEKAKQVVLGKIVPVKDPKEMESVLVSALACHGQLTDALTIYEGIKHSGWKLNPKAALALIDRLQSEGQLDRQLQLLQELQDSDLFIDGCYKVSAYCVRHNHLSSAVELLKKIRDKFTGDEVAAESIFDEVFYAFANQETMDMKTGLELLRAIKEEMGLRPSRNVLDFLLDACVKADDLNAAFFIWKEYQVAGLPYNILSFLRMYRTLLALGDFGYAKSVLKKIPQDDQHISLVTQGFQDTYLRATHRKREKRKEEKGLSKQYVGGSPGSKENRKKKGGKKKRRKVDSKGCSGFYSKISRKVMKTDFSLGGSPGSKENRKKKGGKQERRKVDSKGCSGFY